MVARLQGEYEQAELRHQESLVIYKEIGVQQRIALCLTNLGRLAIDKGAHEQAKAYLQESLSHCRQYGYERESVLCLCYLGYLTLNLQGARAAEEAGDYFYPALKLAAQFRSVAAAVDIMVGMAILLVQSGEMGRAMELLTVALRHPGGEQETRYRATQLLTKLGNESGLTEAATNSARDLGPDLWATVDQHLRRLKKRTQISPEKRRQF
jgi:tetratricopeptide (TPR) repeat protein